MDADENGTIIGGNKQDYLGVQGCLLKTIEKPGSLEVISARRSERVPAYNGASQAQELRTCNSRAHFNKPIWHFLGSSAFGTLSPPLKEAVSEETW